MRKASSVFSVIIIVITIAFIAVPRPAAAFVPVAEPKVWEWYAEGVSGELIPFDVTNTPREWYQLKSDVLKLDGASGICHPFDEGRFGWTGEIFQLVEGVWVKLATTVGWVPNEEGGYKACAHAPTAGIYALFAFYDKAKAPVVECQYDMSEWELGMDTDGGGSYFFVSVDNLPFGTFVSYILVGMSPLGSITGAMSGNGTVGNRYPASGDADFLGYNVVIDDSAEYTSLRISAAGCVKVLSYDFQED